jgi:transcriptional regulator with XRE-family HTH domain
MNEAEPPDMTDQRFAQNLRAAREHAGMSQAALATEMSAMGFAFHQQTIARIEGGTQRVRLAEALALAEAVGTSLDTLARPAGLAREALQILRQVRQVHEARRAAATAAVRVARYESDLRQRLAEVTAAGHADDLAGEIARAEDALRDHGPRYGPGPETVRT